MRDRFGVCGHHWNKYVWNQDTRSWELKQFLCGKPANGWSDLHYWGEGRGRAFRVSRCKTHQLPHAIPLLVAVRELAYRWRTTGYLADSDGMTPQVPRDRDADLYDELADLGVVAA